MDTASAVKWSSQQQAVFDWVQHGKGSVVVEAVAGAGKTTTMVQAVRLMGGTVYMGAYNKKMGDELKKRVADMSNVRAGTFHAAGFGQLIRVFKGVKVDDKKVSKIVADLLAAPEHAAFEGWGQGICALVSLAKQQGFYCAGLTPQPMWAEWQAQIERYDVMDKLPDCARPQDLARLARTALQLSMNDTATIDFDDMCFLPLQRNLRMFQNDWVLIDEAQDTNPTRRMLASRMLKPGGRLMAVGDPHQAIFGFTGADGDSLELIKQQFGACTLELSVTYRCPKHVVAVARQYVSHITAASTSLDGTVGAIEYDELAPLTAPGDAILCRYNAPLVALCFKLIRAGKPAKIEGRAIGEGLAALAGRWKVKTLDALEAKLDRYFERETEKARTKDDEAQAGEPGGHRRDHAGAGAARPRAADNHGRRAAGDGAVDVRRRRQQPAPRRAQQRTSVERLGSGTGCSSSGVTS